MWSPFSPSWTALIFFWPNLQDMGASGPLLRVSDGEAACIKKRPQWKIVITLLQEEPRILSHLLYLKDTLPKSRLLHSHAQWSMQLTKFWCPVIQWANLRFISQQNWFSRLWGRNANTSTTQPNFMSCCPRRFNLYLLRPWRVLSQWPWQRSLRSWNWPHLVCFVQLCSYQTLAKTICA